MATILDALLPVFVTLLLGYFAAWHHDEDSKAAATLNAMVMTYTLPLSLFAGTVAIPRDQLVANLPLAAALLAGLVAPFALTFAAARYGFRRSLGESTLQAVAVSFPSIPFIGIPVLGTIFGTQAAMLTIAISGLATNLVIMPVSIVLLSLVAARGPGQDGAARKGKPHAVAVVRSSLKEPVVWAPLLAVALVLAGVHVPKVMLTSLQLLGVATSGVSLFASGVILRAQTPTVSAAIVASTMGRLVVVPGLALLLLPWTGLNGKGLSEAVVALSMPCATVLIILSVRYRVAVKESASVLLYSYALSIGSMTAAVLLTH